MITATSLEFQSSYVKEDFKIGVENNSCIDKTIVFKNKHYRSKLL